MDFTVRNLFDEEKRLQMNLSGVEAEFMDSGKDSKTVTIPGEQSRTYSIMVNATSPGRKTLKVTTTNLEINLNQTVRFPVLVTEKRPTGGKEAPGIGLIQLIVLMALATVWYARP